MYDTDPIFAWINQSYSIQDAKILIQTYKFSLHDFSMENCGEGAVSIIVKLKFNRSFWGYFV